MDLYEYLCFILLTTVCYLDAEFILTKNEYTWLEATQECTLATPHLTFSESGITPNLDDLPIVDAWLGYTEKMTPFEYFGCAKKPDIGLTTADYITKGDPGKCWSACNNVEAVAVYKHECYCLHNVNVDTNRLLNDSCNVKCPSQPNIVCGRGPRKDGYVSLYKITYTGPITTSNSESNICLWYDKSTLKYAWGDCMKDYRIICYNGNNVSLYIDNYDNWINLTQKCFAEKRKPSNYNNTKDLETDERDPHWTGIIRNEVIYSFTSPTNKSVGKYGYVDSATRELLFTNNDTVRRRAFCVKAILWQSEFHSFYSAFNPVHGTYPPQLPTTAQFDTKVETISRRASSDVGAIVGATVAIIIVIIVVVVLVVLWKRGMKFPFKKARELEGEKTQATNMTYNFVRPDNTIQGTAESTFNTYAEVDVCKMTPGSRVTQNGDTNRTSDSSDEPHPYFVLEKGNEGRYETTKTTPQIHDQHTFNPYNEISLEESSNYDHIGAHANDSKTLGLDNLYNSTTLASSNKYNGLKNNAFKRNDESDDTYNHIDGQLLQAELNQSDNPYNTTALGQYLDHNLQNDHGVTNIAFNSNDECDDTYNHIGDQPGQND